MSESTGKLEGIAWRKVSRQPMELASKIEITERAGVGADLRGKPGARQVSVLSVEAWAKACAEVGSELDWTLRRANLLVSGLELFETAGQRLRIGDVVLEVTCETDPCQLMDKQHAGLRRALEPEWRGGASCRVVSGGHVSLGDAVVLEDA